MKKIFLSAFIFVSVLNYSSKAQNNSFSGWVVISHNQKISTKFNINLDAQIRSKENLDGIRGFLIRPGISYSINKIWSSGLGYAYNYTQTDMLSPLKSSLSENMIWEQIVISSKINKMSLISRVRLEQRFIEQQTREIFSERLRLFNKLFIPLSKSRQLNEGIYLTLQEEILLNVQNKEDLNTHYFDQNRASVALGHQFSKHISSELGYQMNAIKGKTENVNRHILQISLLSKFGS